MNCLSFPKLRFLQWVASLAVVASFFSCTFGSTAHAQLTWGMGGNGGSGTWNTTSANWWNGATNVPCTNGGAAILSGTGGTVTSTFHGPSATSLTRRIRVHDPKGLGQFV